MARVEVPIVVLNASTGLPVDGASVQIKLRSTGANATWWTQETGGTSSTAAVVTDAAGRVAAWVDRGAYNLVVSGTGITTYTEPWEAVPGGDNTVDNLWLPDNAVAQRNIQDNAVGTAELAGASVTPTKMGTGMAAKIHFSPLAFPSGTSHSFNSGGTVSWQQGSPGASSTGFTIPAGAAGLWLFALEVRWSGASGWQIARAEIHHRRAGNQIESTRTQGELQGLDSPVAYALTLFQVQVGDIIDATGFSQFTSGGSTGVVNAYLRAVRLSA